MRQLVQFFIGLYALVAVIVFGGAMYGFMMGDTATRSPCPLPSNWVGWAIYRAALWPKTYFDDAPKTDNLGDWLFVRYTPDPASCAKG